jgi:hypothetical protein
MRVPAGDFMKIHVVIIAACVGAFLVGQTDLAQAGEPIDGVDVKLGKNNGIKKPKAGTAPDSGAHKTDRRNRPGTGKTNANITMTNGDFESSRAAKKNTVKKIP